MDNWKEKIKLYYSEQKRIKKEEQKRLAKEALEEKKKKLVNSFKCHILGCHVIPTGPGKRLVEIEDENGGGPYGYNTVLDWDMPNNLIECLLCHQWTCKNHLYRNICMKCSEKLEV